MHMSHLRASLLAAAVLAVTSVLPAHAGSDPYIGEMMLFGGNFCPNGWVAANGSVLSIQQNSALWSLITNTYGGDNVNTFQMPDLRSRVPVGTGTGPGLSPVALGQVGGAETVTLTANNLPEHSHALTASTAPATHAAPAAGRVPAQAQNAGVYRDAFAGGATVALAATSSAGAGTPLSVRNPYLGMTWCIATVGIYPTRP